MSDYRIPFDTHGNQLHHSSDSPNVSWEPNHEFEGTLTFLGMKTGYSAKYTLWCDKNGFKYTMFIKDVIGIIEKATDIDKGKVHGRWTFQKRGQNYGVRLVE